MVKWLRKARFRRVMEDTGVLHFRREVRERRRCPEFSFTGWGSGGRESVEKLIQNAFDRG